MQTLNKQEFIDMITKNIEIFMNNSKNKVEVTVK